MAESSLMDRAAQIAQSVLAGDLRLGARLIRDLDDQTKLAELVLTQLWPHTGRAFLIGVTGNPGADRKSVV